MSINNMLLYKRHIKLPPSPHSAFLFGPRMTGKTTILQSVSSSMHIDLLDREIELKYRANPKAFYEAFSALTPKSTIIVDEIQKLPSLLDYIQMGIEKFGHQFLLSGSSARKLRRGGANLLGGRALDIKIHPLTAKELGGEFSMANALHYGTLPKISGLLKGGEQEIAQKTLRSYYTTYLKEEIQAEALVRNLDSFQRFFSVAAQSNAQMIEYSNIASECGVSASTVKGFFEIVEDTLIGSFLWPWDRSERKKARPKFYFFDCGVVRAIQGIVAAPPSRVEQGFLFETWWINELKRMRDYEDKEHAFSLWREGEHEIDLIVSRGNKMIMAFECKTENSIKITSSMHSFRQKFPSVPFYIVSLTDQQRRKTEGGFDILPWKEALGIYGSLI